MRFKLKLTILSSILSLVTNVKINEQQIKSKRSMLLNDFDENHDDIHVLNEIKTENIKDNCTCLPYYQCSEDSGRVITDGDGLLDLRGLEDNACTGYFDVCCNVTINPSTPTTPLKKTSSLLSAQNGCGFLKQMLVPWSGILLIQSPSTNKLNYKCGVSIINPRVALTTAHCLAHNDILGPASLFRVKIADYITQIVKIVPHPHFNTGTLQNDIALLILEDELGQVGTICIPPPRSQLLGGQCTVTTWKKNGRLRIIEVPLVEHSKCEKMLRRTRLGKYFQLDGSFVCAGGNSFQDACDGDGGSPLICPVPGQPGRYHQVGIVSWGIGCGERETPGVYVNVAAFRDWIDDVVEAEIDSFGSRNGNGHGINSYRY